MIIKALLSFYLPPENKINSNTRWQNQLTVTIYIYLKNVIKICVYQKEQSIWTRYKSSYLKYNDLEVKTITLFCFLSYWRI